MLSSRHQLRLKDIVELGQKCYIIINKSYIISYICYTIHRFIRAMRFCVIFLIFLLTLSTLASRSYRKRLLWAWWNSWDYFLTLPILLYLHLQKRSNYWERIFLIFNLNQIFMLTKKNLLLVCLSLFLVNTISAQTYKYIGADKCKMCHNKPATGGHVMEREAHLNLPQSWRI